MYLSPSTFLIFAEKTKIGHDLKLKLFQKLALKVQSFIGI